MEVAQNCVDFELPGSTTILSVCYLTLNSIIIKSITIDLYRELELKLKLL